MSEATGVQHPLVVESVEFSRVGGRELLVRVTGRWRRRPVSARQPVLVVESGGERQRFAALPAARTARGGPAGPWRAAFFVPAWLAPSLAGRLTLEQGSIAIPLPPATAERTAPVAPPEAPTAPSEPDDELASARRRVRELERQLEAAAGEPGTARNLLETHLLNRHAEQQIHSEQAQREALERQLERQSLIIDQERARSERLGRELESLRRQADEADHAVGEEKAAEERVTPPPTRLETVNGDAAPHVTGARTAEAIEHLRGRLEAFRTAQSGR
jgi:hypothetical protein